MRQTGRVSFSVENETHRDFEHVYIHFICVGIVNVWDDGNEVDCMTTTRKVSAS